MQLYNKNRVRETLPLPSGATATSDDNGYVEVANATDAEHLLSLGWSEDSPPPAALRQPKEPDRQPHIPPHQDEPKIF